MPYKKKQKKLKIFVCLVGVADPPPRAMGVALDTPNRPLGQTVAFGGGPATHKGQIKQTKNYFYYYFILYLFLKANYYFITIFNVGQMLG
jgi:hypothetical protein